MSPFSECIIIDDDPINIFLHKKIIMSQLVDINVIDFTDARTGLVFIKENYSASLIKKTLLLLDIEMPLMNGREFMEKFNAFNSQIKKQFYIVIVSSSINENDKQLLLPNATMNRFISKPLTIDTVQNIIKIHLL